MIDNVLTFAPKEAASPHATGTIICSACKHEWVGVVPHDADGTSLFECPECLCQKGRFKHEFGGPPGSLEFVHSCGSSVLFIMKRSPTSVAAVFCRNCGDEVIDWFK